MDEVKLALAKVLLGKFWLKEIRKVISVIDEIYEVYIPRFNSWSIKFLKKNKQYFWRQNEQMATFRAV